MEVRLEFMKLLGGTALRARLYLGGEHVANIQSTPEGYDWEMLDMKDGKSQAFGSFLAWMRCTYPDLHPARDWDLAIDRMVEELQTPKLEESAA